MTTESQSGAAAGAGQAEAAGLDSGNYEVIRGRLEALARDLATKAEALNTRRMEAFGSAELAVVGNERVRTEHNCVPRDIIAVGEHLLFGYQVFMGLKHTMTVGDVLSLHRFAEAEGGGAFDLGEVEHSAVPGLLDDAVFVRDFDELYTYYKNTRLLQLRRFETKILAVFQIGASVHDVRVFQWAIDPQGRATYIDNRGEREHVFPASHDFDWVPTERSDEVGGRHPHVSIKDVVFVETVGGDLTIKVEDNTEDGLGIYSEPVDDVNQSLSDGQFEYAIVGTLALLKILPYREEAWRYFVFNTRARTVQRIDAIGRACVQLPEDHGVVFPGGYYLQTGEWKVFEGDTSDLVFKRVIRSPNGEDVLYVFYQLDGGRYVLLPYNMIRKEVSNPIHVHGYSLFDDGRMVVFRSATDEPTRAHQMQVWQTPFMTALHAASAPTDGSYLGKVGNADLVRGISDCLTIRKRITNQEASRQRYEDLIAAVTRTIDSYYWLGHAEIGDLLSPLKAVRSNGEAIIDEFEKVVSLKARAEEALAEAQDKQRDLVRSLKPESWDRVGLFMDALMALRTQRGHLITLREVRYIDLEAIDGLEAETVEAFDVISRAAVDFLLGADALAPLLADIDALLVRIEAIEKTHEGQPLAEELDRLSQGLDVVAEVVGGLEVEDATSRTQILEGISEVFGQLNRTRAILIARKRELGAAEGRAEFAAQFKLFAQSVSSALSLADSPDKCDEQLSRLMVQLEELEARFSEFDEFLGDLTTKREETWEAFSAKKQTLLDARQRRAQNLASAAQRILDGVQRRAKGFAEADELNAYFASDPMVMKLRQLAEQLLDLGDSVKADEVQAKLKGARQEAVRGLRDRLDSFEGGASVIKLGKHRFNVNTQPLELTMVPRDDGMVAHLTGTDFYEVVADQAFQATAPYWSQSLVSETAEVYRGEYLAACILLDAEAGEGAVTVEALHAAALEEGALLKIVREVAGGRYDEGYERGLHDADAAAILRGLLSLTATAGLLRYAAIPRALAALYWAGLEDDAARGLLHARAQSLGRLLTSFTRSPAVAALAAELAEQARAALAGLPLERSEADWTLAGEYLVRVLMAERPRFAASQEAAKLRDGLLAFLDAAGQRVGFEADLKALPLRSPSRFALAKAWVDAFVGHGDEADDLGSFAVEAVALLLTERRVDHEVSAARTSAQVTGLLGQHPQVVDRAMTLRLDTFLVRLGRFRSERVPGYRAYRKQMQAVLDESRHRLRLDEFKPRVLSSFVRNKLINDVYLPLIGDNLAKQLGALGDGKRTDLMGLLLLISPPGYGKTTLMEYVANRLGLVFMKVNGPALGHDVRSLDPSEAPNATARQEVDKINLALEMGNNVMLYLDDIQHTHPELLQKFISLCDAQRRIEGVWKGRTRTYDMRGKKFCVVMAGNPYTESGEKFQIPDMLSNRADVYNLGDVLDGREEAFALSYVENSLTSNPVLAPLAGREQSDIYKIIRMAQGEEIPTTELAHAYSSVELQEILGVFQRLFRCQDVLLKVNLEYIRSASMDDAYRTEPAFKLQGSYRNMNKLAEKVVTAMNDAELEALIGDHYAGESQTLTTGAEQNVLKLAELRGVMTPEQTTRWDAIKEGFRRNKMMGGAEDDPVTRVTGTLSMLGDQLGSIRDSLSEAARLAREARVDRDAGDNGAAEAELTAVVGQLEQAMQKLSRPQLEVTVTSEAPADLQKIMSGQADLIQQTLLPLARAAAHNLTEGRELHKQLTQSVHHLGAVLARIGGPPVDPQVRKTQPGSADQRRHTPAMKHKAAQRPAPTPAPKPKPPGSDG